MFILDLTRVHKSDITREVTCESPVDTFMKLVPEKLEVRLKRFLNPFTAMFYIYWNPQCQICFQEILKIWSHY